MTEQEQELLNEIKNIFKGQDITILSKDEVDTLRSMMKIYNNLKGVGMVGTWLRTVAIWLAAMAGLWALVRTFIKNSAGGGP